MSTNMTASILNEVMPAATAVDFDKFCLEKIQKCPDEDVSDSSDLYAKDKKFPGLGDVMTFGVAGAYGLKWRDIVALTDVMSNRPFQAHFVMTQVGLHVVRGFSRREWAGIHKDLSALAKDKRDQLLAVKSEQEVIQKEIEFLVEEHTVIEGCVYPKYTKISVRDLPTGVVTYLSNCINVACGATADNLPPVPLK